jgi:hypothetical protein
VPTSSASTTDSARSSANGGVQSLERAFDLLERMADAGGKGRSLPGSRLTPRLYVATFCVLEV